MGAWTHTEQRLAGGQFRLRMTKLSKGGRTVDVTSFRGAPTQLDSFSQSDPFGDSTAVFTFPTITPFDDLDGEELRTWLGYYSNVDLWWVPALPASDDYPDGLRLDPLTQQPDLIAPDIRQLTGVPANKWPWNKVKVWEGFVASMDWSSDGSGHNLQLQCQGALFQIDRYLQKPFYPARPWPIERLIADVFSRTNRPELRTQNMKVIFPDGWTKKVPKYTGGSANVYSPVATPGEKWTGFTSRNTGGWEHALTGYVQDNLASLIVDNDSGVTPGNQWTVQQRRAWFKEPRGRRPLLMVRDRFRAPDFDLWVGTPGVEIRISGDSTQSENVIFGAGTDVNGQVWRNAVISNDGTRTNYLPLAASRDVYPPSSKENYNNRGRFVSEAYSKFGAGFAQTDAVTVAEQQLARDERPGWSGTITLSTDPSALLPRWLIRAGMTVLLKGFLGTGDTGLPMHIAAVEASPMNGTVQLTVDTRYRDLLTVAEAQARTRDPLTPTRMLQVNKTSVMVEDIQAPWDYSAGSGFIPRTSTELYKHKPSGQIYPQSQWVRDHPPLHFPHWYVKCSASAGYDKGAHTWAQNPTARKKRWAGPIPILTSERGTISRTEIFCVDAYGRPVKAPFHLSFYYTKVDTTYMPRDGRGPSPYIDGAFESVNPATGQAWPAGNFFAPDDKFIIGWGNRAAGIYNRAGFSPGSEAEHGSPTGLLFDDSTWTFDNTSNPNYDRLAKPGKQPRSALSIYAMFYCEWPTTVYFGGRLYRQNPGAG